MSNTVAEVRQPERPAPQRVLESAFADIPALKYGWRLKLGMIIPSVASNAEAHVAAMLPEGVTLHTTRLKMDEKDANSMLGFTDRVEEAAGLLKDAACQHILVNCTAVTTADPTIGTRISERIRDATGLPSSTTGDGVVAALRALRAHKVVMLTPYRRAINEREVRYLEHYGFEVLDWEGLELNGAQDFDQVTPGHWHKLVRSHRNEATRRILRELRAGSRGGGHRPAGARPRPPGDHGRSNQAATWHALRERGIKDQVRGFGTLLQM